MDGDLIILDDELHLLADIAQEQQLQQQMYAVNPGPSRRSQRVKAVERPPVQPPKQTAVRGRGVKRTRNGDKIPPANVSIPQTIPASDQYSSSVIVDGQDVYYIQEVDDASSESVEQVPYLNPNAIMSFTEDDDDDGTDTDDAPEVPEERPLTEEEEYYNVEPLELSDIWNDLITANQEILILLELSDLKDHIVDARRIEEQIRDMACDYCHRMFPDIKTLDKHVKKVHFCTERFECDSCDGKFLFFARFKDHLNGHTGQRPYQCDECNHQYAFRMGFLVHKILDHMKLNGVYVCPKCRLDCRDAQHYKLHIASHIEFGPSSTSTTMATPAQLPAATARTLTTTAKPSTNGATIRHPPGFAKENERNKFLNVFESFSKNRNVESALPSVGGRHKKH
nr:zinc finger protein Xfin-like [Aedes albopictus]